MILYYLPIANGALRSNGSACAVEVACWASSRMEAVELMRARGLTGIMSRRVRATDEARDASVPRIAPGEVWVRTVYVDGTWERR